MGRLLLSAINDLNKSFCSTEVASFFAPAVKATVEAVLQQMRESKIPISVCANIVYAVEVKLIIYAP